MWKGVLRLISKALGGGRRLGTADSLPLSPGRVAEIGELETRIGYRFRDKNLAEQALTHRSYTHEYKSDAISDYESLEFLGDSILGFVISEFLYLRYPELSEGDLSKMKSYLVSADELHELSGKANLGRFLNLSRGEERTGGRRKKALLADLFESLTAAIYLDGGLESARDFVLRQFQEKFEELDKNEIPLLDHKSTLQERLHRLGRPSPTYRVIRETGPDHKKDFVVTVSSEGVVLAQGTGRSKKAAEQKAARQAIDKI